MKCGDKLSLHTKVRTQHSRTRIQGLLPQKFLKFWGLLWVQTLPLEAKGISLATNPIIYCDYWSGLVFVSDHKINS